MRNFIEENERHQRLVNTGFQAVGVMVLWAIVDPSFAEWLGAAVIKTASYTLPALLGWGFIWWVLYERSRTFFAVLLILWWQVFSRTIDPWLRGAGASTPSLGKYLLLLMGGGGVFCIGIVVLLGLIGRRVQPVSDFLDRVLEGPRGKAK